ncbi:hypothetical protein Bbelb_308510 [Branchiostoma belcheri]|nr:hypothetical protein Bbelb_308510 [Branchiostoma belcheri]
MTNCRLRVAEALPSGQDNNTRPRLRLGVFGDDILIDFRQYFGDRNGRLLLVAGMTDRKREKEILVEFETQVKGCDHRVERLPSSVHFSDHVTEEVQFSFIEVSPIYFDFSPIFSQFQLASF